MSIILRRMQKSCNYVENAGSSAIVSLAGVGDEDLCIGSYSWVAVKYASCQPHPDTAQNHRTGTVSAVRRRKSTSRRRMTAKAPLCTGMMPCAPRTAHGQRDTVLADPRCHYYGSMVLTTDVPEELELYYGINDAPYNDYNGSTFLCERNNIRYNTASFLFLKRFFKYCNHSSLSLPSTVTVTTCQGMNLPLCWSAFFAAVSNPPQQGTSMRTMVTLLMSLSRIISVSFSE